MKRTLAQERCPFTSDAIATSQGHLYTNRTFGSFKTESSWDVARRKHRLAIDIFLTIIYSKNSHLSAIFRYYHYMQVPRISFKITKKQAITFEI